MAQTVNTNISSLTAQRNLATSQKEAATAMQRLSSGLRINSAKDDAAGLAIASRLTAQINGINQAVRNANDGISTVQIAEGALSETTNMLQRIRELAVQSANASNSSADRTAIQTEVTELVSEIDRIASATSFGSTNLLNGSFSSQNFQVGSEVGETISVSISDASASNLGTTYTLASATYTPNVQHSVQATTSSIAAQNLVFTVDGETTSVAVSAGDSAKTIASSISTEVGGITASAATTADVTFSSAEVFTAVVGSGGAGTDGNAAETIVLTVDGSTLVTTATTDLSTAADTLTARGTLIAGALQTALTSAGNTDVVVTDNSDGTFLITDKQGRDLALDPTTTDGVLSTLAGVGQAGGSTDAFTIQGVSISADFSSALTADAKATALETAINNNAVLAANLSVSRTDQTITLTDADGDNITIVEGGSNDTDNIVYLGYDTSNDTKKLVNTTGVVVTGALTLTSSDDVTIALYSDNGTTITTGTVASPASVTAGSHTASSTRVSTISVATVAGANEAIAVIDSALDTIATQRASLGASQNRFDSVVSNLQVMSENTSTAKSRIMDADFAVETAQLARTQILQQAGISVLAQANAQPQNILALLQ